MPHTEKLLNRWASTYRSDEKFIKDGIINVSYWGNTHEKILFLLKELNMAPGSWSDTRPLDIQRDFRKTADEVPWKEIGQWAYGILNRSKKLSFKYANIKNNYNEACRSVAIINFKKIAGGNASSSTIIREYAIKDSDFLKEQVQLIDPKIIVCCGRNLNFNLAKELFADAKNAKLLFKNTAFIAGKLYKGEKYFWVDYVHPSMRKVSQQDKYESLMDIVNQIP